jgi:excisionase family DNA binding protein
MMKILLDGISVDDFFARLRENVLEAIQNTSGPLLVHGKELLLSREQTCSLLHISLATFHRWCRQGKLRVHKAGGRILVKKQDVDACLQEIKIQKQPSPRYFNSLNQNSLQFN